MIFHIDVNTPLAVSEIEGRKFFFDTSAWCYIFSPQHAGKEASTAYATLLADISRSEAPIIITPILISEYINARLRLYYNGYKKTNPNVTFKDYRQKSTKEYQEKLKIVLAEIQDILKFATPESDLYMPQDINYILKSLQSWDLDMNDSNYIELSRQRGYTIVTHDQDFKNAMTETDIISAII